MKQDIEQSKIVINDLMLNYYHSHIDKPKKTLLFLHGWGPNSTCWFQILPYFIKNGYQVYALDFPGFGKSQKPEKPLTIDDYLDIVVEFIKKLKMSKPILIGHSHGGRVSIKLAAEFPHTIDKLVLVDSAGIKNNSFSVKTKKIAAKIVKPVFKIPFMRPIRKKIYKVIGAEDYLATPEFMQTFSNIVNEDLTPLLPKIQNPTLLMWGENDTDTPLDDAKKMKSSIPKSELKIIKNAGHYSFLDQPEEFTSHIAAFI